MLLSKEDVNVLRLTSADAFELAAKVEAAILAKLASAELPEPAGRVMAERHGFVSGRMYRIEDRVDGNPLFTADQLRQAYAQGAAAQLSAEPVGEIMWDEEEQRRYVQYVLPLSLLPEGAQLYTRKEPK